MRIRTAEISEAGALTAIAHAAKRYWSYPEEWMRLWSDELTVNGEYVGTHEVYVAEDDAGILGWCAVSKDGDTCWIDHCWVQPAAMGRGTGRALVQHARAVAMNWRSAALKVIADPNAEAFYRKLGFRRTGEHPSKPEGRRLPILESSLRE